MLGTRHLSEQMCRSSKAVKADACSLSGCAPGAITDEARAQERRGLGVGRAVLQSQRITRIRDGELGGATVDGASGELRVLAEILQARAAVLARPASARQPWNANTVADTPARNAAA